uniref:Uncharacterized protein n=1 Tax=Anguilla anguilla TaxID=7936 RepID=A0A0E9QFG1_ANGAN
MTIIHWKLGGVRCKVIWCVSSILEIKKNDRFRQVWCLFRTESASRRNSTRNSTRLSESRLFWI